MLSPSITKWPIGKLSSILLSDIIKASMRPLTCSARNSNLFLKDLMFKCAKPNLFKLSLFTDFKSLTQSPDFWLSKDASEFPYSVKTPVALRLFSQLTTLNISLTFGNLFCSSAVYFYWDFLFYLSYRLSRHSSFCTFLLNDNLLRILSDGVTYHQSWV